MPNQEEQTRQGRIQRSSSYSLEFARKRAAAAAAGTVSSKPTRGAHCRRHRPKRSARLQRTH